MPTNTRTPREAELKLTETVTDNIDRATTDPDENKIYDLIIVGYGPSGETAANFAAQLGLETIVVEREEDLFTRQRAIALDDEVMRIFQSLGIVEPIRATMHEGLTMTFVTPKGKEILRLAPEITDNGYWQQNFFHQPWLEAELRVGVASRAEKTTLVMGWEANDVVNGTNEVTVSISKVDDPSTHRTIRGRYVLGCDGGSSPIRKALGFDMGGASYPDKWFDVQGELLQRVPGTPHFKFICDPKRPGVDCPCPGGMHRYEWRMPPGENAEEIAGNKVWPILKDFSKMATDQPDAGIDESFLDIKRTWDYTFHVRNCEKWKVGRVFLLGDAAHIMPPFAGQGMSAGVRDAANIVWKIKMVLDGIADDAILDTYQDERQKHVAQMTKYSQMLGSIVMVKSRPLAALRNGILRVMRHVPGLKAYTLSMKAKPAPAISTGFISAARGKKTPTGLPFPNVDVGTPRGRMLSDDALGYGIRVLGLDADPRTVLSPEAVTGWEKLGAEFVTIRSGTLIVGEGEIGDPVGRLYEWFKKHNNAKVVIVRPDHIVYGVDSDGVSLTPPHVAAHRLARAAHAK